MSESDESLTGADDRNTLLGRLPPPGYQDEWMGRLAERREVEERPTVAVLVFRLGEEWLALRVQALAEVTEDTTVHRIPHRTNPVLRGLVNIRGELQLAIALRALLGLESEAAGQPPKRSQRSRMILMVREGQFFAARVDEVIGVVHIVQDQIETVPVTLLRSLATFSRGLFPWRDERVALLDDELIFHSLMNQHL